MVKQDDNWESTTGFSNMEAIDDRDNPVLVADVKTLLERTQERLGGG